MEDTRVTIDDLLMMIGEQAVTINSLNKELARLRREKEATQASKTEKRPKPSDPLDFPVSAQ